MSLLQPETWQDTLDLLTLTAKKDGFFKKITNRSSRNDAVTQCFSHSFYRIKLMEWISFVKNSRLFSKSQKRSSELRSAGNKRFQLKEYSESVKFFTESIAFAEFGTQEFALAVGNRSAALFFMGHFKECLGDIELALDNNYPESLQYKLYSRQGDSLAKLNKHKEAIDAYKCALESLEKYNISPNVEDPEKDSMSEKEIQIIMKRSVSQMILKDSSRVTVDNSCDNSQSELSENIPELSNGENEEFAYASASLKLMYTVPKGRHVITKCDVKLGDILFVEKPYAFVLLPDHYKDHCHHCCKESLTFIPCATCAQVYYCGKSCKKASWNEYHKWECAGGLQVMHSVGVAHLALRVVLKSDPLGLPDNFFEDEILEDNASLTFGNKENNYHAVYSLLPHTEKMEADDFFQYAMTATLLVLYLCNCTQYFSSKYHSDKLEVFKEDAEELNVATKKDGIAFIGKLLLRHIAQLICNAHAITKIQSIPVGDKTTTDTQVRIATAIYPSVSMMNHSCNPNIVSSFCNEFVIVRASRAIKEGSEVFNCYGPHFRRMSAKERQECLKSQYFFTCKCEWCTKPSEDELQNYFSAWRCPKCNGPLLINDDDQSKSKKQVLCCCDCKHNEFLHNFEHFLLPADKFFQKGMDAIDAGNVEEALNLLLQCLSLRKKYLYKSNSDISACLNQIARCYAALGDFNESTNYLKKSVCMVDAQFGESSVELANELQTLSDVMLCDLRQSNNNETEFMRKIKEVEECVERTKNILQLNYGSWTKVFQEVLQKEKEIYVLKKTFSELTCQTKQ